MNMAAAPTNWKSDFGRLASLERKLSMRLTVIWKVYTFWHIYLSFEGVFVTHMHHPLNQQSSHQPSKVFLIPFDVISFHSVLLLPWVQVEERLIIEVGIDFLNLFLEFGDNVLRRDNFFFRLDCCNLIEKSFAFSTFFGSFFPLDLAVIFFKFYDLCAF